jgi:hypothetical protein
MICDDAIVPLICPTCQIVRGIAQNIDHVVSLHGVVFDILVGRGWFAGLSGDDRLAEPALAAPVRLRPAGFGATAFARFAWSLWHGLA